MISGRAYGLTTLLREDASCVRGEVRFSYPAKNSKTQSRPWSTHPVTAPCTRSCRHLLA
jgi:hypothetical protein